MTIKMPPSENNQNYWMEKAVQCLDRMMVWIKGIMNCVDASTKSECVLKRGG